MTSIWWIRRDVRLGDNPALQAALQHGAVIPVFILDPHLMAKTPVRRQSFLFDGLHVLQSQLLERGSRLLLRRGNPQEVLAGLMQQFDVQAIFAEEDFTPYARARDARISSSLPLQLIHGQTVLHPLLVHKADGLPYTVFTPFSRTWKSLLPSNLDPLPAPSTFPAIPGFYSGDIEGAELNLGLRSVSDKTLFPSGEPEALRRLAVFVDHNIYGYASQRDRMDMDGTSSLSPYLRFGMLSIRQAVAAAQQAMYVAPDAQTRLAAGTWLNELIWREFYISILYHFPHISQTAFNPSLVNIPWRDSDHDFNAWTAGLTGVPIVDAGLRQLSATGWMHNRARMIVASYLVKDLLINWQWGERWFMQNLLDGDPAANNGGWQWIAGTGTDAAPYFRIFNPVLQSQKFDPDGFYIRKWVPELVSLPNTVIHAPWERGVHVASYPRHLLVEHALVKDRTLKAYAFSKNLHAMGK